MVKYKFILDDNNGIINESSITGGSRMVCVSAIHETSMVKVLGLYNRVVRGKTVTH